MYLQVKYLKMVHLDSPEGTSDMNDGVQWLLTAQYIITNCLLPFMFTILLILTAINSIP